MVLLCLFSWVTSYLSQFVAAGAAMHKSRPLPGLSGPSQADLCAGKTPSPTESPRDGLNASVSAVNFPTHRKPPPASRRRSPLQTANTDGGGSPTGNRKASSLLGHFAMQCLGLLHTMIANGRHCAIVPRLKWLLTDKPFRSDRIHVRCSCMVYFKSHAPF